MRNRATTPLSKAKIRQSWNKYNLYNLNRFRDPHTSNRTFFQQKWTAKSLARTYHGEQVRESQWTRMFSKRLRSVIPMSPLKLAEDDGSGMAAGRGSGLESQIDAKKELPKTPYTSMTFAPLERRLDVAVFRAMFASSARQARQFVLHGAVTVNGRKMRYPGYLLNPGDLFQVEPDSVMFATGAPKTKFDRGLGRRERYADDKKNAKIAKIAAAEAEKAAAQGDGKNADAEAGAPAQKVEPRDRLKALVSQSKRILDAQKRDLPGKRKADLRRFQRNVRRVMSSSSSMRVEGSSVSQPLEEQFEELLKLLKATRVEPKPDEKRDSKPKPKKDNDSKPAAESAEGETNTETAAADSKPTDALSEAFRQAAQDPSAEVDTRELSEEECDTLKRALTQMRDNPFDHTKPYATPWRPRDYMSAFAFIPRYLEVNQNICAAVYLRHPVARPGFSEVPSPYSERILTGAFSWYLRRR